MQKYQQRIIGILLAVLTLVTLSTRGYAESIFDNITLYRNNTFLTIKKHMPFPYNGRWFDHTVTYTTAPYDIFTSDACAQDSDATVSCYTGDRVVYNPLEHSARLYPNLGTDVFTYYEKNHTSEGHVLDGTWERKVKPSSVLACQSSDMKKIVIPFNEKNTQMFVGVNFYYYETGDELNNTYYLIKDKYNGRLELTANLRVDDKHFYLLDSDNNYIYDFDQLDKVTHLNDSSGKYLEECDMVRTS